MYNGKLSIILNVLYLLHLLVLIITKSKKNNVLEASYISTANYEEIGYESPTVFMLNFTSQFSILNVSFSFSKLDQLQWN